MKILALDFGTQMGWATYTDGVIGSGTHSLKKRSIEDSGMRYEYFGAFLREMDNLHQLDVIFFEQPRNMKGHGRITMPGYMTRVQQFVAVKKHEGRVITYASVSPATIKIFATGNGRASKQDMMDYFERETGLLPKDENEADAYAILRFAMNELSITG